MSRVILLRFFVSCFLIGYKDIIILQDQRKLDGFFFLNYFIGYIGFFDIRLAFFYFESKGEISGCVFVVICDR